MLKSNILANILFMSPKFRYIIYKNCLLIFTFIIISFKIDFRIKAMAQESASTGSRKAYVIKIGKNKSKKIANQGKKLSPNKDNINRVNSSNLTAQDQIFKKNNITTKLKDTVTDENVVVTGYRSVKRRFFTGATASVKMTEIKLDGVADISRMLEGRVAGLSIQNVTGTFGSAPRINIRGGASIIGNVQPLWVIDGVVYENLIDLSLDQLVSGDASTLISSAVAGLNSSDIEDIQVLKDASATSFYGARALNGAIVIRTRQAKRNTPIQVNYRFEQSFRSIPSYNNFDLLNSQETMAIYQEMEAKGYFQLPNILYGRRGGVYYQMYKNISTIDPKTGKYYMPNTPDAKNAWLKEAEYANTNWFRQLFRVRPIHIHNIGISVGGKNTTTYLSLGYYKDWGWSIADNVQRITGNIRNTIYITPKLNATLIVQGNFRDQLAPGTFARQRNSAIGTFERNFDINPFSYALGTSRTLKPKNNDGSLRYYRNNWAPFNIFNEYQNNYTNINLTDFKIQAQLSYKILPNLNLQALFSTRQVHSNTSHTVTENSNVIKAFTADDNSYVRHENLFLYRDLDDPNANAEPTITNGGLYNKTSTSLKSYLARISANYEYTQKLHYINAFGFIEIRSVDRSQNPFQGYGIQYDRGNQIFPNPNIFHKLANENTPYFSITSQFERGITSSFNINYHYDSKYIITGVFNIEGSNAAGKNSPSQFLPTWNLGLKWLLDKEDFLRLPKSITTLSLTVNYGLTAKINENAINSNVIFRSDITNRTLLRDRETMLNILHLENQDLTWEKMYEFNVGMNLGLLRNIVSISLDLYQRNAFDLIDLIRTSGVGGQHYKYANVANMRTRGIELALNSKNIRTVNFQWITAFTASFINQKITRLLSTPSTFNMVDGTGRGNVVGAPRGSLFSFNFQGLNQYGLPTFDFGLYPSNNNILNAISGADFTDAEFSKTYLIYHGSIEPNTIVGLSNSFKFKEWELTLFITAQAGNKIRLNPTFDPSFADLNVFLKEYNNRWLHPGDELHTNIPVIPSVDLINLIGREGIERAYNTYNYSQNRVADGSFVRMKNISLAYYIPESWLKNLRMQSAYIRLQATNPFLIYSDKRLNGQDPEFYKSGGVSLPTPQQYTMTINIIF